MTLFLALLLAASSLVPTPGRAEAQMRCRGASPRSAPCARVELPAAGLARNQVYGVYGRLMSCCRSMPGGCAMTRDCPMGNPALGAVPHRPTFAGRRCLVSIRVSAAPSAPAAPRARRLLTAARALAPPVPAQALVRSIGFRRPAFWTHTPILSSHADPHQHGLRAPPAA